MPRPSGRPGDDPAQPLDPYSIDAPVGELISEAKSRWLLSREVNVILEHAKSLGLPISRSPGVQPPGRRS